MKVMLGLNSRRHLIWMCAKILVVCLDIWLIGCNPHAVAKTHNFVALYVVNLVLGWAIVYVFVRLSSESLRAIVGLLIFSVAQMFSVFALNSFPYMSQAILGIPIVLFGMPGPFRLRRNVNPNGD